MRRFAQKSRMAAALAVGVVVVGCSNPFGGGSSRVRAELVRLPGGSMSATVQPAAAPRDLSSIVIPWTSQVNLTSVRAPVVGIRLRGGSNGTFVYQCAAGTSAGCMVELNGPALQDLLGSAPVAVSEGTYDVIDVLYCPEPFGASASHQALFTGTASIGGSTYYTKTTGALGSGGPAEPVTITYNGCSVNYPISPPLVVEAGGGTTVVRLYFDILDIAAFALPSIQTNPMWYPGGCTPVAPLGSAPFVCAAYPDVIAVPGTTPPLIEHYRVNNGATVGLVFDASTDFWYGGYLRSFTVEDQIWNPGFAPAGSISGFTRNADGSYRLQQHAYSDGTPGALFPAWRRATHAGTLTAPGGSRAYSAVRLP